MNGWDTYGSGSGPEREPSEERGRAAWSDGEPGTVPPWASAETQTGGTLPPPWVPTPPPGPVHPAPPTPPYTLPPTPVPTPPPPRRVGRTLAVIALVVVIGAGTGAGTWYLVRGHRTGPEAGPVTSSSAGVTPSARPATSPPPSSGAPQDTATATPSVPAPVSPAAGYRSAQDPVGYTIDVPQGWTRRQKQGKLAPVVFYDSPSDGRQLQIFEVTEATPYESLTLAEKDPGFGFARQPGYEVLDRDHGDTWAELSYRYDDADKGARQVIDHRFRAADGTLYAIRSSGPADLDPALVRTPLATAVRSFCPTGTECV
ncbi:hypothetical protein ACYF6T_06165 [Streptomyces sp. 7R007]